MAGHTGDSFALISAHKKTKPKRTIKQIVMFKLTQNTSNKAYTDTGDERSPNSSNFSQTDIFLWVLYTHLYSQKMQLQNNKHINTRKRKRNAHSQSIGVRHNQINVRCT